VIGGVPTILEVPFMCRFKFLSRNILQGSVSTNLSDPIRKYRDIWEVEVGILLIGNIDLIANRIPPRVHFVPLFGQRTCFSTCFLLYRLLLHQFCSKSIGFGL
jgi:hypothetical protein